MRCASLGLGEGWFLVLRESGDGPFRKLGYLKLGVLIIRILLFRVLY